ncbi:uncharacterized protein E0L32_006527 [Thyridium curvatum]|uniref:Uncharacterized protein n=1 Tax=Thyridium curvatum TaxID=1093900 RepID=A0A507B7Q7_9PEZI|nr:uncharacterized protein E0L32_006527 [Thyridium curvatum]TPX13101.1 hypothetical protein E0L32_006527 [Thyridium curvatum]
MAAAATLRCVAGPTSTATRSAASLFVQLSAQHRRPAGAVVDFLLPNQLRQYGAAAAAAAAAPAPRSLGKAGIRNSSSLRRQTTGAAPRADVLQRHAPQNCRALSTTAPRLATHTLFNPAKDEDGNDMKLEITPRAAKRLSDIMKKDSNPHLALRIQVESGGCHGFQYIMKLITLPDQLPGTSAPESSASSPSSSSDEDATIREDDTIFTFAKDDEAAEMAPSLTAPKIILDTPSLELLKGSKVDYTMELIGSQFKIVDNPLATSSCGCGTSFDIKI